MRKLLLLLVLNLSIAAMALNTLSLNSDYPKTENNAAISEAHKPMLVEGRTWWYTQKHFSRNYIAENGISVGAEVEIDGVKWHKIDVTSTAVDKDSEWSYNTTRRTVAYMREDDDRIYTAYFDDCTQDVEGIVYFMLPFSSGYGTELLSYEYKNIGDTYLMGNEGNDCISVIVKDIIDCTNSGFNYTKYVCEESKSNRDASFIEGLGCITDRLFFAPLCSLTAHINSYVEPVLRYITDPDGTIIYEGIGGYKLWESTGIDNVIAEGDDSCRWYNLQGIEIDEPTSPGIYIRSSRNGNEKIAIR